MLSNLLAITWKEGLILGVFLVVCVLVLVVMPMLRNRKEKKRLDEYNRTIAAIQPGSKVITVGGICGEVAETADEKTFVLKTGAQDGRASLITLQREAIWWTDAKPAGEPQGDGSDTAGTDEVTESKVEPAPAYPARERGEYPKEADHIQPGNKVVTVGGIEGEAVEVKEESGTIVLKTGGDSYVEVDKGAVRWTDAAIPETSAPETPTPEAADSDTADKFVIIDTGNQKLRGPFRIHIHGGNMGKYGIKKRIEVILLFVGSKGRRSRTAATVNDGTFQLFVRGVQIHHQFQNFVHDF